MNIEARKIEFIQEFLKLQSEEAISKFEKILQQEKDNLSGDSSIELSQAEREGIDRGLRDVEEGRVHSHDSVKKLYERYL